MSLSLSQVPPDSLSVTVVPDRREVAVVPSGELDLVSADLLEREVRELRESGFEEIIIDLRGLRFMDSSGLHLLLGLRDDAVRHGHQLTLRPGPDLVQRVFAITGTRRLFDWRLGQPPIRNTTTRSWRDRHLLPPVIEGSVQGGSSSPLPTTSRPLLSKHASAMRLPLPPPSTSSRRRSDPEREAIDRVLLLRARTGSPAEQAAGRRAAVDRLLPLAKTLARRYHRGEEPLEDLEQVACLGLLKAIDGFDLNRETPFGSYAVPTIVGELRRHFRDKGWTVRVPRDLQELSHKLGKAQDALTHSLGRPPTSAELAARLETTVERILEARALGTAMHPVSLDRPLAPEPGAEGEALVERLGASDPGYERADDASTARSLLRRLPDRERRILELRFREELTQTEIGERLGISQMNVSRVLRRLFEDLAKPELN